jgi:hypothetical protein
MLTRRGIWAAVGRALRFSALSFAILFGLASIIATSGGGGGGGGVGVTGTTGGTVTEGGTGTVALLVGDGPADDYDHIYVYVTKVSLIPAPGNAAGQVVIFQSPTPAGHRVDLLAYRDEDFLLGIRGDVPAGRYEKIRLEVASVEAVGGPCDLELIKLPSGKIDLNPRGGFEVRSGESLAIRLDMDANKSINLHPAGNSGKCIFRPVVFVDITPGAPLQRCPGNVTGTIIELVDRDKDRTVDGFVLDLTGARGRLTVWLEPDAPVFAANGLPATVAILAKGQQVWARGRLDVLGRFRARVAVVGEVLTVDGTAQGPVQTPANLFPFRPDAGQELVGDTNVRLFQGDSLVFRGCDAEVGWDAIASGVPARVFGKLFTPSPSELRAAVVLLRQVTISGEVVGFADSAEGRLLTVQPPGGVPTTEVFVPTDTPIVLEGDGRVPLDLVCTGTRVRVLVDPDASQATATEVTVLTDSIEGMVTEIRGGRTLIVRPAGQDVGTAVHVRDAATILDQRSDNDALMSFEQIKVGDHLKVFGLKPSSCNLAFEGFVVLVVTP